MAGIHRAMEDPDIHDVVVRKSAQVGWTDGGVINFVLWLVDTTGRGIIWMFPRKESAQDLVQERFNPTIEVTPRIRDKIPISTQKKDGNKELFRKFPGGWIKFIGSHSATGAKSSSAPVVIFEEPDDADTDVGGQGGAIRLLKERTKTYRRPKRIIGGTPTTKGLSAIDAAYAVSDKAQFYVPCHDCGEAHVLSWSNVSWLSDADIAHEVYGKARPSTASYACPHCGSVWDDAAKNRNVARAEAAGFGWKATAAFHGVAGFALNELMSSFPGARLAVMVEKYLAAKHEEANGKPQDLVAFWNNQLGEAWEYQSGSPDAEVLKQRAEDYQPLTVPAGGLVVTAGVDVQHDRLAVVIRAWGRGEESWLLFWGELYAKGSVTDLDDPVWQALEKLLFGTQFREESGLRLRMSRVSIDSGDGGTNDAVYKWVRPRQARGVLAIKGQSTGTPKQIYTVRAEKVDNSTPTKADRYGVKVFMVGTELAKDLLVGVGGRLTLEGVGPARLHWYKSVSEDYWAGLLSEVKAPHGRIRGRMVWQKKTGVRNEALDCEVYALHASRSCKVHLMTHANWDELERDLRQGDLFSTAALQGNGVAGEDDGTGSDDGTDWAAIARKLNG